MSEAARETEAEAVPRRENADLAHMRDEVWAGLDDDPPHLSPKWFYDTRGSELFEEITRLPEYYPTRTERELLERWGAEWIAGERPGTMVELGAGSARKTRILLDAMQRARPGALYVPLDVAEEFLEETARALRTEYPELEIVPEVVDLTRPLELSARLRHPAVFALLGGTLGNFAPPAAHRLLSHVRTAMGRWDAFLLGVDLRPGEGKSEAELVAAYDDEQGVTAAFNLNMLVNLNRLAGTDFRVGDFRHRALYNEEEGRIEMHVEAVAATRVSVPGRGALRLAPGETIRTEISCKYDRTVVRELFAGAGLRLERWVTDPRGRYALVVGRSA
jgi:L-histidine N-alpha-methyltransferase